MALATAVKAPWSLGGNDQLQHETAEPIQTAPTSALGSYNATRLAYNDRIAALRPIEYPQLQSTTYLDHAGTTLPSKSLVDEFAKCMLENLVANPHSVSAAFSQFSSRKVDDVRLRALKFFNADPNEFDLVFTANATAGIKLVGDCLRAAAEEQGTGCWYGYHKDAHTSLVGLRETLGMPGLERATCFGTDNEVDAYLMSKAEGIQPETGCVPSIRGHQTDDSKIGLFAYPAQSNMDGRRLPFSWIKRAKQAGVYTLLDAAALVSTAPLDLSDASEGPDFTVLSFYKIFGFPDLGALIVRKDASDVLRKRRYFGGGTVEVVTTLKEQWHIRKQGTLHEQLEDGTLPIHSILALDCAFNAHTKLFDSMAQVSLHTNFLADKLYEGLAALKHGNRQPVCRIYGRRSDRSSGPVISFNIRNQRGAWESNYEVEKLASVRNIQLRTGGVCNPGGIASALELTPWEIQNNFSAGKRCGGERDVLSGKPTGVIRVSLGALSTLADTEAFIAFVQEFFVQENAESRSIVAADPKYNSFYIESLSVYPIKSCAGWNIPDNVRWPVRSEGLAWDREWCLVHPGTRAALSQKQYPKMALLHPMIDTSAGLLHVAFHGTLTPGVPAEISVPLSADPTLFVGSMPRCKSSVCGDDVQMQTYASTAVNNFFSAVLETPCVLARFPPTSGSSTRHAKEHLIRSGSANASIKRPLLLSNESPILVVSRSSLNRLNETIKSKSPPGWAVSAAVFRANVVIAEDSLGIEQPFVEDKWRSVDVLLPGSADTAARLDVLGPCRRCQMVCIDQRTGKKSVGGEPFISLSKTRRRDGKVWFGVHSALVGAEAMIQVGDQVVGGE